MIASTHVVSSIQQEASGPSYSVPRLCQSLSSLGDDVKLHCLGEVPLHKEFSVCTHRRWSYPARLGVSPGMFHALQLAAVNTDIMHNHGLWMMPNIYSARAARRKNCLLVTSPRGTLAPWAWARSRWIKRAIWPLQKEALIHAACLHATAEEEYNQIRKINLDQPVAVIPNGIDIPELYQKAARDQRRKVLFLGRIHPIKGIDLLLHVWRRIERNCPDWELYIVGPDDGGYLRQMRALSKELALKRVFFEGALYGQDKLKAYQAADLYILPTHTENYGVTVAEALANGVPAIVTKGAPWEGLNTYGCGWWVNREEDVLYQTLLDAMSLSRKDLRKMGEQGRFWMQHEFSWQKIGQKMHLTYEWLLGGGPIPDWVRVK